MNELLGVAVLAHRNGRYQDAIDLLLQILQTQRQDWLAWFYLAMSYGKMGNMSNAVRIFKVIIDSCPDDELRLKSQMAVPALEAELRAKLKQATGGKKRINLDKVRSVG